MTTPATNDQKRPLNRGDMRHAVALLITLAVVMAGCSSEASDTTTTTTAPVDQTTTTASTSDAATTTTTTVEETTTTTSASDDGVTVTKDIVYLEQDGDEYLVDVYVPNNEGPWPVVLAFHGVPVSKDHSTVTMVAEAAAEAGMLVFAANWVAAWPDPLVLDAEWIQSGMPTLQCALAFAQQEAAGFGGDSDRTVFYATSGGASSGASLVLGPSVDLPSGCLAPTPPKAPVGAVLGDAEYFLHNAFWDDAFDEDLVAMQTIVAENVDPALWKTDLPARIRVWAAEDGSFSRSFNDPWDEDGWFAQRDPDGSIREDLDELGELDDGVVTYVDEGLLFATRLHQAGIDATFDILPGGHRVGDKLPELVAYLLDAAGTN
jgi:hypothetical protein